MPIYKTGNMWDEPAQVYIVTTNSMVLENGELVMGGGAALDMKRRLPEVAKMFGDEISARDAILGTYFLIVIPSRDGTVRLGAFQVKRAPNEMANRYLIGGATRELRALAEKEPNTTFVMNFPGIGLGRLSRESVEPMLAPLPDNVIIYSFD